MEFVDISCFLVKTSYSNRQPIIESQQKLSYDLAANPALRCMLDEDRTKAQCKFHTTSQNELWSRFGKLFFCEFP